jgi:hypothetical protein
MSKGHTDHCVARLVHGDGECECGTIVAPRGLGGFSQAGCSQLARILKRATRRKGSTS